MKGNIFNLLQRHDDSADEDAPKKYNKKEIREIDKNLRETHGDYAKKGGDLKTAKPKQYEGDKREGKREFERKSGTVKQAFGDARKKGGKNPLEKDIRKGSTDQNQANDQEEDVQEEEEEEEEEAPAISLEDYLKERNITDDGPVQEETLNLNLQKIAQDSKMKVVVKTKTGTDLPVTKKNNDIKGLAKATLNSVGGKAFEEPREPREQGERRGGRGGDFKKFNGERREFNGEKREFKGERREYKPRAQAQPEGDAPAENGAPKTESNEAGNQERDGGDRRPRGRGGRGGNGGNGAPRGGRGGRGGRPTDGPRDPAPEGTQTSGRGGKTFVKRGGSRNETHLTEADFPSL